MYKVYAVIIFVVLLVITQLLVYQKYKINRAKERTALEQELEDVAEEFQTVLRHNISSANTIAMLYAQDSTLSWFDSTARNLIHLNPALDLVEFLDSFTTTHIYPLKGYEFYLGKDPLEDPVRRAETMLAVQKKDLRFAGPFPMRNSNEKGIAGRQAIFFDGRFIGIAVVVSKLSTIQRVIPEFQNKDQKFVFQLSKVNVATNKREYYFDGYKPRGNMVDSVFIPGEDWTLHAAYAKGYSSAFGIWILALFGILFSAAGAAFVYFRTHATMRLEETVKAKTRVLHERMKELSAIYQISEVLKDERQSVESAFTKVVNIIPVGWQHSDACAARISVGEEVYATDNWVDSPYLMRTPLQFVDGRKGYVEVIYCREEPPEDEGPFVTGERDLLNSLAEMLMLFYNKKFNGERVARSEAKMRSMIEATPVPLMLCDKDLNILSINSIMTKRYHAMTELDMKVGDNFIEVLKPERREDVRALFNQVMIDLEPVSYEAVYDTPHGQIYLHVIVTPVTSNAEPIGVCTAMHDVTKRKQRDKENRKVIHDLMRELSRIVEYARELAQKMHEPLANISGSLTRASEEKNEQERATMLEEVKTTARNTNKMIGELEMAMKNREDIENGEDTEDTEDGEDREVSDSA